MVVIKQIAVHHSGGRGNDDNASTINLVFSHIDNYHMGLWHFISSLGYYAGYNAGYDPKTRTFKQWRAIGEETAAQRGFNSNTFSLMIIGNYNRKGWTRASVDPMTEQIEEDVAKYLIDLMDGNKRNLKVAPNTKMNFSRARIYAHRFFSETDCFGTFLSDNWARDLLVRYKQVVVNDVARLTQRLELLQKIMQLLIKIRALFTEKRMKEQALGGVGDRECSGSMYI